MILLAPVSTGAEVLADGHIHIYAPLRGRALAGVNGNANSMIFCNQLEAELVSIAGHYKVNEDLRQGFWGKRVQVGLDEGNLEIVEV